MQFNLRAAGGTAGGGVRRVDGAPATYAILMCVQPVSATPLASLGWRLEAQGLSRTLIEPQSNRVQKTL